MNILKKKMVRGCDDDDYDTGGQDVFYLSNPRGSSLHLIRPTETKRHQGRSRPETSSKFPKPRLAVTIVT